MPYFRDAIASSVIIVVHVDPKKHFTRHSRLRLSMEKPVQAEGVQLDDDRIQEIIIISFEYSIVMAYLSKLVVMYSQYICSNAPFSTSLEKCYCS